MDRPVTVHVWVQCNPLDKMHEYTFTNILWDLYKIVLFMKLPTYAEIGNVQFPSDDK